MNWTQFFEDHNIEYVTRGSNVKKGNINVACPFCGDDPSHHMGVHLTSERWGCWRGQNHAGKKASNLVKELLQCSYSQATLIVKQYSTADPENLTDALALLTGEEKPAAPRKKGDLLLPESFRKIKQFGSTSRYWNYLKDERGFTNVDDVVRWYALKCALTGRFSDRIIWPIYRNDKLVSWVGRALGKPVNAPRYLFLSEDDEDTAALDNRNNLIFNEDAVREGGKILFVVEGPFDAMKVDYYGDPLGAKATCPFGTRISEAQVSLFVEVSKLYERKVLLFDAGATEAIFLASDMLTPFGFEVGSLPDWIEDDPGSMKPREIRELVKSYLP